MKRPERHLALVALLVRDYDEAIAWYADVLGFEPIEDRDLGDGKRWVTIGQPGSAGSHLLLAKAASPEQAAFVGNACSCSSTPTTSPATCAPWPLRARVFSRRRGTRTTERSPSFSISTAIAGT